MSQDSGADKAVGAVFVMGVLFWAGMVAGPMMILGFIAPALNILFLTVIWGLIAAAVLAGLVSGQVLRLLTVILGIGGPFATMYFVVLSGHTSADNLSPAKNILSVICFFWLCGGVSLSLMPY